MLHRSRFVKERRPSPRPRAIPPHLLTVADLDRDMLLMVGTRTPISQGASCLASVDFPDRVLVPETRVAVTHDLVTCMMAPYDVRERQEAGGCTPDRLMEWFRRIRRRTHPSRVTPIA